MERLKGKVAFITGVARGQGRAHAVRLASEGADIVGIDICENIDSMNYPLASEADLAETVKLVEQQGRKMIGVKGDVRSREQLASAIDRGMKELGRLDIVVANAGIIAGKADTYMASGFVEVSDIDLIGAMNTVAASLPHLKEGASIIITGSTAGMMKGMTENVGVATGGAAYGWSKRILISYVETLALQLAPYMVRLNGVHPTNCNTHLLHNVDVYRAFRPDLENPTREDAMPVLPLMQAMPIPFIEPEDISALIAFLASDDGRYITGLNIRVDAGALLKTPPTER